VMACSISLASRTLTGRNSSPNNGATAWTRLSVGKIAELNGRDVIQSVRSSIPTSCPGPLRASRGIATTRQIGVSEVTYYRWRQEFGGLKSEQVKRLKDLELENSRLRKAVSDLTLDKLILQEAARGNF
jgi:putative transposase